MTDDNAALSNAEKGFINSTTIPVLKYLSTASSLGWDASYLNNISDYIAEDMMLVYLKGLVKAVQASTGAKNYPEHIMAELIDNIHRSEDAIKDLPSIKCFEKRNETMVIQQQILYMQKQVSSKLTNSYQANTCTGGN